MKYKNLMAKALYDNVPESPEELAFRKGDILTVIEQNTGGLEGWWLCSLHGRQGIAPGNRLKLLIGPMFEAQSPPQGTQQTVPTGAQGLYKQQGLYQVPPRSTLAADNTPTKVVTPTRLGQAYTFSPGQHGQRDLYDVPPCRSQGVYDVPPGQMSPGQPATARNQGIYDVPPSQTDLRTQGVYDVPPSSQGIYSVPPCRTNADVQEGNYDFPQPLKHKQEGIYDVPPPVLVKQPHTPQSHYDFPPNVEPPARYHRPNGDEGIYDVPPPALHSGADPQRDVYDFPRGVHPLQHKSPPADRDGSRGIYDVPAPDPRAAADGVNRLSFSSTGSTRSSMSTSSSSTGGSSSEGRLLLDVDAAVQRLYRLQQGVELSVGALNSMATSPHWWTFPFMERHANDVRTVLDKVRAALGDFIAFGKGATANAASLSDSSLHSKLRRQLGRLEDSQQILVQTHQALENGGWALDGPAASRQNHNKSDDLDRFLMVSRTVPDDAKQLAQTVGGSAELLFRRTLADGSLSAGSTPEENPARPLTSPSSDTDNHGGKAFPAQPNRDKDNLNHSEKCVRSWMEDYDYVHLQGKEDFERQQKELLEKENIVKQSPATLGQEQINQLKKLEQEVIKPVENDITQWTSPAASDSSSGRASARDRQLLGFYAAQCEQHFSTLLSAVDAFFACVGAGQPPRVFVAHGKFVILSAHKLVFIGDTLSRQASAPEVANRAMNSSNVLCDLLKTVVAATKTAALNYPNAAAIQGMVDRVADLSRHAQQFKEQLLQMASL